MDQRLPPVNRMHTNGDYARAFNRQQKAAGKHVVMLLNPRSRRSGGQARLGVMIPNKAVKTAVRRHQLKRWVRELFRRKLKERLDGFDAVVLFRSDLPEDGHALLDDEILGLVPRVLDAKGGQPRGGRRPPSARPS
jgi:ribonuclease P protein component